MTRTAIDAFAQDFARVATSGHPEKVQGITHAWEFANTALGLAGSAGIIDKLKPHIEARGWHITQGSRWFDAQSQSGIYVAVYPTGLWKDHEIIDTPFPQMRLFVFKPGNLEQPCIMTRVVSPWQWRRRRSLREHYRRQRQY